MHRAWTSCWTNNPPSKSHCWGPHRKVKACLSMFALHIAVSQSKMLKKEMQFDSKSNTLNQVFLKNCQQSAITFFLKITFQTYRHLKVFRAIF